MVPQVHVFEFSTKEQHTSYFSITLLGSFQFELRVAREMAAVI